MLASAIPPYRLPREVLKEDIDDVVSKGIEVKTNCEIGKDVKLDELTKKHDAVLIAIGLSQSRSINIPGVEGPEFAGNPVPRKCCFNRDQTLWEEGACHRRRQCGNGCGPHSAKLGVKDVSMVCLESAEEMPAWKWEVDEALEEGIRINHRWGPKAVKRQGDKVHRDSK